MPPPLGEASKPQVSSSRDARHTQLGCELGAPNRCCKFQAANGLAIREAVQRGGGALGSLRL